MATRACGRTEFAWEKAGDVIAHTNDELAAARLRNTQLPRFLDLGLHAVAERAGFRLNAGEELTLGRALNAEHVFHHEHPRAKDGDVIEKAAEKVAAFVFANARSVIGRIYLPHGAEALARWPAHDDIQLINSELCRQFGGRELRQVFAKCKRVLGKVCFEGGDGLLIEVNRCEHPETRALHSKAETATTTEEVEASERIGG